MLSSNPEAALGQYFQALPLCPAHQPAFICTYAHAVAKSNYKPKDEKLFFLKMCLSATKINCEDINNATTLPLEKREQINNLKLDFAKTLCNEPSEEHSRRKIGLVVRPQELNHLNVTAAIGHLQKNFPGWEVDLISEDITPMITLTHVVECLFSPWVIDESLRQHRQYKTAVDSCYPALGEIAIRKQYSLISGILFPDNRIGGSLEIKVISYHFSGKLDVDNKNIPNRIYNDPYKLAQHLAANAILGRLMSSVLVVQAKECKSPPSANIYNHDVEFTSKNTSDIATENQLRILASAHNADLLYVPIRDIFLYVSGGIFSSPRPKHKDQQGPASLGEAETWIGQDGNRLPGDTYQPVGATLARALDKLRDQIITKALETAPACQGGEGPQPPSRVTKVTGGLLLGIGVALIVQGSVILSRPAGQQTNWPLCHMPSAYTCVWDDTMNTPLGGSLVGIGVVSTAVGAGILLYYQTR